MIARNDKTIFKYTRAHIHDYRDGESKYLEYVW